MTTEPNMVAGAWQALKVISSSFLGSGEEGEQKRKGGLREEANLLLIYLLKL